MTPAEKVGQLNQVFHSAAKDTDQIRQGKIGSVICAFGALAGNESQKLYAVDEINKFQHVAVNESRLGIPLLIARDVIHGHRTVAPIPLGQACSWSYEDVRKCAETAATEAYADGIRWSFAPMLDIARDPRWGRVAEG